MNAVAARPRSNRDASRVRITGTNPTAHQAIPERRETMRGASNVGGIGSRDGIVKRLLNGKMVSVIGAVNGGSQTFKVHRCVRIADDYGSGSSLDTPGRRANRQGQLSRSLALFLRPRLRVAGEGVRGAAGWQRL